MKKTIIYLFIAILAGVVAAYFINSQENFKVSFDNLSEPVNTGGVEIVSQPKLNNNSFTGLSIKLLLSGDSIKYTFDIKNTGTKDGIVSSYTINAPTCSGGTDAQKICDNLTYKLLYTESQEEIKEDDIIKASETKNLTFIISYNDSYLPSNDITISNISFILEYKSI